MYIFYYTCRWGHSRHVFEVTVLAGAVVGLAETSSCENATIERRTTYGLPVDRFYPTLQLWQQQMLLANTATVDNVGFGGGSSGGGGGETVDGTMTILASVVSSSFMITGSRSSKKHSKQDHVSSTNASSASTNHHRLPLHGLHLNENTSSSSSTSSSSVGEAPLYHFTKSVDVAPLSPVVSDAVPAVFAPPLLPTHTTHMTHMDYSYRGFVLQLIDAKVRNSYSAPVSATTTVATGESTIFERGNVCVNNDVVKEGSEKRQKTRKLGVVDDERATPPEEIVGVLAQPNQSNPRKRKVSATTVIDTSTASTATPTTAANVSLNSHQKRVPKTTSNKKRS